MKVASTTHLSSQPTQDWESMLKVVVSSNYSFDSVIKKNDSNGPFSALYPHQHENINQKVSTSHDQQRSS